MKACTTCHKEKDYSEYHKRNQGSKDGYQGECKACCKVRRYRTNFVECERCGEMFDKRYRHTLCVDCRKPKPSYQLTAYPLPSGARCNPDKCVFYPECKHNIRLKKFSPYCFKTSKYHVLYELEYDREEYHLRRVAA